MASHFLISFFVETSSERKGLLEQLNSKLESLKEVLDRGWDQRSQTLNHIAQQLFHWTNRVTKEKVKYHPNRIPFIVLTLLCR